MLDGWVEYFLRGLADQDFTPAGWSNTLTGDKKLRESILVARTGIP
jgi:hypothetical protein